VLAKDDKGVWSGTTGPLPPDLYVYSFVVDGAVVGDPANPFFKPVATGGIESIVQVFGDTKQVWDETDVSHGVLHRQFYWSTSLGESREFFVYTPPGYDPAGKRKYPVLYLLHGVMDTCNAWVTAGRANIILDNLIAARKAEPMLMVMPVGYGFPNVPDHMADQFNLAKQRTLMDAMGRTLFGEVVPIVERTYKTSRKTNDRAVAGYSMGGAQALYFGLNHPDQFGFVGSFSGAFIMYSGGIEPWFSKVLNHGHQELVIACGKDDFLISPNRKITAWLLSKGITPKTWETPGGHTWNVWRRNLADYVQVLFK
jgi:enterochelin esterase family protein